ncbi:hypothetical protein FB567DRAFT_550128 [Paraphoma chrysanthemicola]|uniref:Uncharacterized protein n=1 Tax=Paraphoma chrysanthemicola TaxID=798071 RepID=A0A8K0VWZ4_9PLEO|nr:hypothetical protein FB567DRAFT_550128 [Paraphoma chrysanthemicola]
MATDGHPLNDKMTGPAVAFMESQIKDPELRNLVRPESQFLRKDLVRYTQTGVVSTQDGQEKEREFDVIMFGTGFNVAQYLEHENIRGLHGIDLQTKWKDYSEALYGLATSDFPNMFYCFGPKSGQVWSSQQDTWEHQARSVAKAVRVVLSKEHQGIEFAMHPK